MKIQFVCHREGSVLPSQRPAVNKLAHINKYSKMCWQNDKSFNVKAGHILNNKLRRLEDVILETV
jgi:hypothetical protein